MIRKPGRIEIVRSRSVVFVIHALAGTQKYETETTTRESTSMEEASSRQTHQTIITSVDYDPWEEIEEQLPNVVDGAEIVVSPVSSTVMVRGSPRDIGHVREFLEYLNRHVLRPVTLSVHVYSVEIDSQADYDLG